MAKNTPTTGVITDYWGRGSYRWACPNCGGTIVESRLALGLPCEECLSGIPSDKSLTGIYRELVREGKVTKSFTQLVELEKKALDLIDFFEKAVRSKPWGAQRAWARRLVRGDSFSIIAPTGVGKTTFGLVAALYFACKEGRKAYIVLPTTTLVVQAYDKLLNLLASVGAECADVKAVAIHSKMKVKERKEALASVEAGDFDILISTSAFMRKYADKLGSMNFAFVFADDVDAVLKSGKSVDAILKVVGFSESDIEAGVTLLKLTREQASLKARLASLGRKPQDYDKIKARIRELDRKIKELQKKLEPSISRAARLVVSSATGRPRGPRVKLFRVLLGFEAGGRGDIGLRNVIDSYVVPKTSIEDTIVDLVKRLKDGILIFVPIDKGIEGAEALANKLREEGINAEAYHAKKPLSVLEEFAAGKIPVLVGVANYYGTLVRGLDLPRIVKYAIFAGVPRHKFGMDIGEPHPSRLIRLLSLLSEIDLEQVAEEARRHLANMRKLLRRLSPAALQLLSEKVLQGDLGERGSPAWIIWEAYNFLRNALSDREVWDKLSQRPDVAVVSEENRLYILIPDPATYIQASGRTSRLYAGGITKGLSIVVVDDERVFRGLVDRVRWITDTKWVPLEELDLDSLIKDIEEDRKRVGMILAGEARIRDLVKTALLVVESPNKARTIASFFGQPSIRILPGGLRAYEVATGDYILTIAASGGHVYDLAEELDDRDIPESMRPYYKGSVFGVGILDVNGARDYHPVYTSIKRCMECGYQYTEESITCPRCGSTMIKDSRTIIEDLRRLAWESDVVLIGTDPDTEGEKIGWDIALLLRPFSRAIYRLEFHEVTRKAIREALENLRDFHQRLVDAQIVRRIEDRWIGYTLSPLLWCDFWPNYYCPSIAESARHVRDHERCATMKYYYNLSAGRVQTPTLGWVVKRTEEAREKILLYTLIFNGNRISFREDEVSGDLRGLRELVRSKKYEHDVEIEIKAVSEEVTTIEPLPPYSTDALIADANRFLGFGAPETMSLAQNLFEWGLITYHRTDSTRVSDRGIQVAREWLEQKYGELSSELFRPRTWGAGGAHEAIRPVRPIDAERLRVLIEEGLIELPGELTWRHLRLYDLIFRRFVASQMRPAKVKIVTYKIEVPLYGITLEQKRLIGIGSKLAGMPEANDVEAGFLLVWHPYFRVDQPLPVGHRMARVEARRVPKVPLYTQGEIIEEMKRKGIGRPSTYAKIVDTLFKRGYIARVRAKRGGERVAATPRGRHVYYYLTKILGEADEEHYGSLAPHLRRIPALVSEERTKVLEELMDSIERGEKDRQDVLDSIFNEIQPLASPIISAYRGESTLQGLSECIRGFRSRGVPVR